MLHITLCIIGYQYRCYARESQVIFSERYAAIYPNTLNIVRLCYVVLVMQAVHSIPSILGWFRFGDLFRIKLELTFIKVTETL